jgi:hypothetical protein
MPALLGSKLAQLVDSQFLFEFGDLIHHLEKALVAE